MTQTLLDEQYSVREGLREDLAVDLLGPASEDELIADAPITRYIVGVLFPVSGEGIAPEQDHDVAEDDAETGSDDPAVSLAHVRYPSSMGLTFAVDPAYRGQLSVEVAAARYVATGEEGSSGERRGRRGAGPGADGRLWARVPVAASLTVDCATGSQPRQPVADGLSLMARVRPSGGALAVTLALINTNRAPAGSTEKDALSFFQARLRVSARDGASPFVERPMPAGFIDDADLRSYALLYSHSKVYAVGHGCGVDWEITGAPTDHIETTFLPSYELALAISNPGIDLPCLSLEFLASEPKDAVLDSLEALPSAYRGWIAARRRETVPAIHETTAREHLDACDGACARMGAGIRRLRADEGAWSAFRLAQQAMLTVRARGDWHRDGRPPGGPRTEGKSWYPFQLAFLLLCLEGIADPEHSDRGLVDLLWFPTGGGKTEAYLGLIAFAVFLRRIRRGPGGAGVTALMRYTLRLLTIQQFERAAALICACDRLRSEHRELLGEVPISLGLWVGKGGTPNKRAEAKAQLKKLRADVLIEKGNPVQLKSCPWCGTALGANDYYLKGDGSQLVIACPEATCPFRPGLPVYVIDEDVYDFHPTLVIATADKFAGIAWLPDAHRLFNLDMDGMPPPELIIQDELHLIAGPLGTLAGLYEAAVDGACASRGHRPKVVASTATIRRADSQAAALFARPVAQFPPPGLDSRDSFFAVEAARGAKGTRLYVGVLAPGSSQTTLMVRAYARLLQSSYAASARVAAKDPYLTLLGYFNSLRVLGGARMQVHNDIEDRLKLLEPDDRARRKVDQVIELTSRESSAEIPSHLKRLALTGSSALDVVLATNMISVGVDIDRLGLMVVMGQPQGTAEYIQATSRVGRKHPGLAVVLLNASRSRDRSHYEGFVGYHGALYRQVESSSVTPYSPRARDRALHAALVASVRLRIPALRGNEAAADIGGHRGEVEALRDELLDRARLIGSGEAADVARQLDEIIDRWRSRAASTPKLKYRDSDNPELALLVDAADPAAGDLEAGGPFGTLWSLRDVDRASNLYLLR